ncbi:uncharacterized protein LOC130648165 [Hydractinia symbiolongicarpus]|uniref:uncharacterized protein LOC130648165 n=1 Tax=Hydractinia symbiolongicarpus TaxID=13093 RepID=UPI00254B2A56|nr:uncharacterized protein LOC130648165 [Hydractinia symbiolongicarpus]
MTTLAALSSAAYAFTMKEVFDIETWKKKRQTTFLVYMSVFFLRGLEKSANTATLWIYLTKLIKTDNPDLYYGLINIAVYIPPMLLSSVVARYADKTRRTKMIIIILNFIAMIGSILYVIPSPIFPFVGKLLNGGVIISRPLIIGETARSYPSKDVQSKMSYLVFASTLGFMIGPCVVLPFAKLNIRFGQVLIQYGNISGIILLFVTIFIQLGVMCFAHDLSREFDLKESESCQEDLSEKRVVQGGEGMTILKKALHSKIILFIFAMSISCFILGVAFGRNFPVLILDVLSMSYGTVAISLVFRSIAVLLLCLVGARIKLSGVHVYWVGILSQLSFITLLICQYIIVYVRLTFDMKIAILVLYNTAVSFAELGEQLFLVVVFVKLVSSKNQSYLEGIRGILKQTASILGGLLSLMFLKYAAIFVAVAMNVMLTLLLCYFRRDIMYPTIQLQLFVLGSWKRRFSVFKALIISSHLCHKVMQAQQSLSQFNKLLPFKIERYFEHRNVFNVKSGQMFPCKVFKVYGYPMAFWISFIID